MENTKQRMMATLGVMLALAVPVIASLYIAHRHSIEEERINAAGAATEVLRRVDLLFSETESAYHRLQADNDAPCSDAHRQLMRDIDMSSAYLQATGHVVGNRFECSSLGGDGQPLELGPVSYQTDGGVRVRRSVDLGLENGKRFLVIEFGGYATAVLTEFLVDFGISGQGLSFGAFSASSGTVLSHRGVFDPAWSRKLGALPQTTFFDGGHLVILKRSTSYNVISYAAIPAAKLEARTRSALLLLVPLGIAIGVALATAGFWLARRRASLPSVLRGALRRREFSLHYQPIVSLHDQGIVGVEALLRWQRGGASTTGPEIFIPVAEACGLIPQITRFVIEQLVIDVPRIASARPGCYVSMNVSALDLQSFEIVRLLQDLLDRTGLDPAQLMVEATEHSLTSGEVSRQVVMRLRDMGVSVAIDDFGTGYSNLSTLTQMQCDILKIDRTFVDAVGTESATSDVALHILRIAHTLNLKVIAEGIETELQAEFLRRNGAEYGQGWLFARAMPLDELIR